MTKLEKVVKGLEYCAAGAKIPYAPIIRFCTDCPYNQGDTVELFPCTRMLVRDALELLKEREKELKNTNTLYKNIKAQWQKWRQQADATDIELKFLVELLDWLEADEPPKEGNSE